MEASGGTGRVIGFLILSQLIGGILLNFFLTAPLFGTPGFMVNGALYSQQIGYSVLLALIVSGLSVAIAIMAFPVIQKFSVGLALAFLSLSVVSLSTAVTEQIAMMSLVSFSIEYSSAEIAAQEQMESMRIIVTSARNWAHYIGLVLSGGLLFLFYAILYRFRLVPRLLSAFGLVATTSQLIGVIMPIIGLELEFLLLAPLALSQIVLGAWLLARGFSIEETA